MNQQWTSTQGVTTTILRRKTGGGEQALPLNNARPKSSCSSYTSNPTKKTGLMRVNSSANGLSVVNKISMSNTSNTSTTSGSGASIHRNESSSLSDAAYVSVLKSDILVLQKKVDDILRDDQTLERKRTRSMSPLLSLSQSTIFFTNETKSLQTKVSLLEILLEELVNLQSILLRQTESITKNNISNQETFNTASSSLSYIQPFIQFSQNIGNILSIASVRNYKKPNKDKDMNKSAPIPQVTREATSQGVQYEVITSTSTEQCIQTDLSNPLDEEISKLNRALKLQRDEYAESLDLSARLIEKQSSELQDAQRNIDLTTQECASLKRQISELQIELKNVKKSEDKRKAYEGQHEEKFNELQRFYEQAKEQNEKQTSYINNLNDKIVELTSTIGTYREEENKLNLSIDKQRQQIDELHIQINDCLSERNQQQLNHESVFITEENEKLKALVDQLKDRIKLMEFQKVKLQQQIINIKDKNMAYSKENRSIEEELSRLKVMESEYFIIKDQLIKLAAVQREDEASFQRMRQLQSTLTIAEERYKKIHQELSSLKEKYKTVTEELQHEKQRGFDLENELRNTKQSSREKSLKLLEQKANESEKHSISREKELEILTSKYQDLLFKYEQKENMITDKDEYIAKLQDRNNEYKALLETMPKHMFNLEAFIDVLGHHENNILNQELGMMREAFEKKLMNATNEVKVIQRTYEVKMEELKRLLEVERTTNERKLEKFRERCMFLEERLQMLEIEKTLKSKQ